MDSKENNIPFVKPLTPEISIFKSYLQDIFDSGILSNGGKYHRLLSEELVSTLKVKNIILTSNCTAALRTLLGINNYDENKIEIIVPAFTFVASLSSIVACGFKPVFADVLASDGTIDPESVSKLIGKKTFAILGVHCYGNPCNHEKLSQLAKENNIYLFYDAAHAFGVCKDNKSILDWGDASALSFHATKIFNTCEGGAVLSDNDEIISKARNYINNGFKTPSKFPEIISLGMNAKMSEINAAFGLAIIKDIHYVIKKRREIYNSYLDNFKSIFDHFKPFLEIISCQNNYSYAPFILTSKLKRDELCDYLLENNIISKKYFYPLVVDNLIYSNYKTENNLEISRQLSNTVICLPIYPSLSDKKLDFIIDKVIKFFI